MEFKGNFKVKKTANEVRQFFVDPARFAECLPGIQNYEIMPDVNNSFKANFKLDVTQMKIPHMSTLTASVNARIFDKTDRIQIDGNGRAAGVGLKFNIVLQLGEDEGFTKVEWFANVELGMLSKLLGDENIRKISEPNIDYIIHCISTKLS